MLPLLVCAALTPQGSGDSGFDFIVGARTYGADDWAPLEEQWSFGLRMARRFSSSDFGWELGLSVSSESEVLSDAVSDYDLHFGSVELGGGLRWMPSMEGPLQPYPAAGINWQDVELTATDLFTGQEVVASDSSTGLYVSTGLAMSLASIWRVGVDYRRVFGTSFEAFGLEGDVDNGQLGAFIGFGR
jgi:opacity protein-like surface antigen